jgi:RHS repeat-associated protein
MRSVVRLASLTRLSALALLFLAAWLPLRHRSSVSRSVTSPVALTASRALAMPVAASRRATKIYNPCPSGYTCDTIPPLIIINPSGGTFKPPHDTVSVTIYYCSAEPNGLDDTTHHVYFGGNDVTSQFTYTDVSDIYPVPDCTPLRYAYQERKATGKVILTDGRNQLNPVIMTKGPAYPPATQGVRGFGVAYYNFHPTHGVSVTANQGLVAYPTLDQQASAAFTVRNLGQRIDTIVVSAACVGTLSCAAQVDSLHMLPGTDTVINFTYLTAGKLARRIPGPKSFAGTRPGVRSFAGSQPSYANYGVISVTGYDIYNASAYRDSAYTNVDQYAQPVGVVAAANNPGNRFDRDLCLAMAVAPGAAYQCGDLRLTHELPAVRTLNRVRAPTLIYSSSMAHPHPLVAAQVTLNSADGTPDTVVARLSVGATLVDTIRYAGSTAASFANGATQRIVLGYDAIANGTSLNSFTFAISAIYNSSHLDTSYSDTGRVGLVSAQWNKYGAGWWVAGIEGLKNYGSTGLFWTNPEGSYALYQPVPGNPNAWVATPLDRPDTIKLVTVSGHNYYIRYAEHGNQVWFDGTTLLQAKVLDRLRDSTTFTYYPNTTVASLTVPSPSGGLTYWFNYDTNGYLINVYCPKLGSTQRYVYVTQNSSHQITSLKDPDGDSVVFQYSGTYANVVTARTDKRGTTATFGFDAGQRLSQVVVDTGTNHLNLTTAFSAQETSGLLAPVASTAAFTEVNGPRKDTTITKFYLDYLGEPAQIQDALGRWTELTRNDPTYAALVSRIEYPNQRVVSERYDARGNPAFETDSTVINGSQYATTSYVFDQKWDYATAVVQPMGETWLAQYDTTFGNRVWQQVGPVTDSTRRVHFTYNGQHRLASTSVPLTNRDSVLYDSTGLGNVIAYRTPTNYWTFSYRDGLGRDTVDMLPVDSADHSVTGAGYNRVRHHAAYDLMDRVIADSTFGVAASFTTSKLNGAIPAETLMVWTAYDPEGAVDTVRRRAGPDTNHINVPRTVYVRDAVGRVLHEYAPEATLNSQTQYTYDAAGNVVTRIDREGNHITQTYDAVNRVTQRTTPEVDQPFFTFGVSGSGNNFPDYPNNGTDYSIWADTATFVYDMVGHLRYAQNHDAIVARVYDPRGLVLRDSLYLRTYQQIDSGGSYSHGYGITNSYDADGRRTKLKYPYSSQDSTVFAFDPTTGLLASTTGPDGSVVSFTTDAALRHYLTTYPGGVTDQLYFDNGGRVQRSVGTGSASGTYHSDTLWYDARGKVVGAHQIRIRTTNSYAPLGQLLASETVDSTLNTPVTSTEAHEMDAFGNDFMSYANQPPPPGTTTVIPQSYRTYQYYPYNMEVGKVWQGCAGPITPNQSDESDVSDTTYYQPDGAQGISSWQNASSSCLASLTKQWKLPIYGGDAKVHAMDMHKSVGAPGSITTEIDFEEYWYDALGRRVYRRSRDISAPTDCETQNTCHSVIERFILDGDQILEERRALDFKGDTTTGTLENGYSTGEYAGVVEYVHAGGIDAPVEVMRRFPEVSVNEYAVFPHANWSGLPDLGTYPSGSTVFQVSNDTVKITWPARSMLRSFQLRYQSGDQEWAGGLVAEQRDPTGSLYMRNRYYDSNTGRFTQEDPIGLAGGLNTYGFAAGDPVNYSDPFGLCTPPESPACQVIAGIAGQVAPLESVINTVGEVAGVNGLGRAADDVQHGNLGSAAVNVALSVPIVPGEGAAVSGTKAVVRGGLEALGLSDKVLSGVRGVLSSGRADQVLVRAAEDGGANVIRWVAGKNGVSSALYHYVIDNAGKVIGAAKQAYDKAGAIAGTFKIY